VLSLAKFTKLVSVAGEEIADDAAESAGGYGYQGTFESIDTFRAVSAFTIVSGRFFGRSST
jgi:hypothetical protein